MGMPLPPPSPRPIRKARPAAAARVAPAADDASARSPLLLVQLSRGSRGPIARARRRRVAAALREARDGEPPRADRPQGRVGAVANANGVLQRRRPRVALRGLPRRVAPVYPDLMSDSDSDAAVGADSGNATDPAAERRRREVRLVDGPVGARLLEWFVGDRRAASDGDGDTRDREEGEGEGEGDGGDGEVRGRRGRGVTGMDGRARSQPVEEDEEDYAWEERHAREILEVLGEVDRARALVVAEDRLWEVDGSRRDPDPSMSPELVGDMQDRRGGTVREAGGMGSGGGNHRQRRHPGPLMSPEMERQVLEDVLGNMQDRRGGAAREAGGVGSDGGHRQRRHPGPFMSPELERQVLEDVLGNMQDRRGGTVREAGGVGSDGGSHRQRRRGGANTGADSNLDLEGGEQ